MQQPELHIPGYTYGTAEVPPCPISMHELDEMKLTAGFSAEDHRQLRFAAEVLASQTSRIVSHWRSQIIASIPHLARHSQTPDGKPIPEYLAASDRRFEQWILDTCLRNYDQEWLNYQYEIARRHTGAKKNAVDAVVSTPYVPLRHVIAFIPVMNQTIKPYLGAGGQSGEMVDRMHLAWCRSIQLQLAIWAKAYLERARNQEEW